MSKFGSIRCNMIVGATAVGLCVASLASTARAEFLASAINPDPQLVGAVPRVLALAGPTVANNTVEFTVPARTTAIITFSAECSVSGANLTSYANIDIQVDMEPRDGVFVTVPPTNGDDQLCTSNGSAADDGRITVSRTVADTVPRGTSAVRVVARTVGGNDKSRIDDLLLIVSR